MSCNTFVEEYKLVQLLQPATDAAGRTSAYVSLKFASFATIIVSIAQGNAATVAITIEQASAVAGTGSKVITNTVPIWSNLDTAATDTLVRRTAGVALTTDAGVKNKQVCFQIDPADLDIANGFDCICIKTGASNAANVTSAVIVLNDRYKQATPPSSILD
jgi:hypothetical protein